MSRVILALSAVGVFVAGFEHARLFHRGYGEVDIVGPLFWLNGIASAVVVLLLVFGLSRLFALGALAIAIPSLVSIFISHSSSFLGFSEGGYDSDAIVIVVAEIVAAVFALAGLAVAGRSARA